MVDLLLLALIVIVVVGMTCEINDLYARIDKVEREALKKDLYHG